MTIKKGNGKTAQNKPEHREKKAKNMPSFSDAVRLNKMIANAGVCSRREADVVITSGAVTVNGKTVTEMGYKVKGTDVVKVGDQTISMQGKVYFILNKPKDFISTPRADKMKKTVMNLMKGASKEAMIPATKMDGFQTGIQVFTNDSDLALKLNHPKFHCHRVFHVLLNRPLTQNDLTKITEGFQHGAQFIKLDKVAYANERDKKQVGVEIKKGKDKSIVKAFEALGYEVHKMDRVTLGIITKKLLARGQYRALTKEEVDFLKMLK